MRSSSRGRPPRPGGSCAAVSSATSCASTRSRTTSTSGWSWSPRRSARPARRPRPASTSIGPSATILTGTASSAGSTCRTCAKRPFATSSKPRSGRPILRVGGPSTTIATGGPELFFRDRTFGLTVKPDPGGTLVEIDYRPWPRNLSNVLSRRREAYHRSSDAGAGEGGEGKSIHELGKTLPPEAADLLRYDRRPRHSLIDHFYAPGTSADAFRAGEADERGDLADGAFAFAADGSVLRLERRGSVRAGDERHPLAVRKTVESSGGALRIGIELENLSDRPLKFVYGSEWNLLAFPHEMTLLGASGASLYGGALLFEPGSADAVWSFALRTLSQSEGGFDIIHQGYCLCPVWSVGLAGKGTKRLSMVLKEPHGR